MVRLVRTPDSGGEMDLGKVHLGLGRYTGKSQGQYILGQLLGVII